MYLGRVVGRCVVTQKDPELESVKLLVVVRIDGNGKPFGDPFIAADSAGAGAGEDVFLCSGTEAAMPFVKRLPPTDATILGIVDTIAGDQ